MRVAISEWRKKKDKLLDIERDMNKVTGRDKVFYLDQQTDRECRLSEKVDDVYEMNQEIARIHAYAVEKFQQDQEEE